MRSRPWRASKFFRWRHDSQVDDLVVVAGEHDADDVGRGWCLCPCTVSLQRWRARFFPGHVTFWPAAAIARLLSMYGWRWAYGFLHHAADLTNLRQEHLPAPNRGHPLRSCRPMSGEPLRSQQGASQLDAGFLSICLYICGHPFPPGRWRGAPLRCRGRPFFGFFSVTAVSLALELSREVDQAPVAGHRGRRLRAAHILPALQVGRFLRRPQPCRRSRCPVHGRRADGVIEKGGCRPHGTFVLVGGAAKLRILLRPAPLNLGVGQVGLDPAVALMKSNGVVVASFPPWPGATVRMFGVENNVFFRAGSLPRPTEWAIGVLADAESSRRSLGGGLGGKKKKKKKVRRKATTTTAAPYFEDGGGVLRNFFLACASLSELS